MTVLLAGCVFWLGFWAGYLWQAHHDDLKALLDAEREASGLPPSRDRQEAREACPFCRAGYGEHICFGPPIRGRDPQEARERLADTGEQQAWEQEMR